jgi:rare lipoprotein A (peptidoglycan hydrolase)
MKQITLAFCFAALGATAQAQEANHRQQQPGEAASQGSRVGDVLDWLGDKIVPPAKALAVPGVETHGAQALPRERRGHISSGRSSNCVQGERIITAYYAQGRRTASGARFDPRGMTAAHRHLPFGTRLMVINPRNGKSVTVTVNDRGPFVRGVSLDLSVGAAKAIGMSGTGAVCMAKLGGTG